MIMCKNNYMIMLKNISICKYLQIFIVNIDITADLNSIFSSHTQEIAFLRLDGDMYISTIDPLKALYPKIIKGG